jgi:uncharacterized membrane protein HdeD (DUF308 family)
MLSGGPLLLGLVVCLLGIVALMASAVTGLLSALLLGILLVAAGLLQLVQAHRHRREGHLALHLVGGVLSMVVGFFFCVRPLAGMAALTLLFGGYLTAMGLLRGLTSLTDRYASWGWDAAYGLLALSLGVLVLFTWPISALWVVGALVSAELVARGLAMMALGVGLRRAVLARPGGEVLVT